MSENAQKALKIFEASIGELDGYSESIKIEQERINAFADATLDHQFIHIDPVKSAESSPYKTTIAHGYLTMSLIPHFSSTIKPKDPAAFEGLVAGINYGMEKMRFPSPVPVNSVLRAKRETLKAELKGPNVIQLTQRVTIEIEGGDKPACVAETLTRFIYA
ncbi:MAG: MaoC family dehydratase [Pseudomonadales bacterium]|nr:MaoC family dehydratase [Pseudomonadales bacterium]